MISSYLKTLLSTMIFSLGLVDSSSLLTAADVLDESVVKAEAERVKIMAGASRCGVSIFADGGTNGGSGVLISADGYALTNFHVTKPCGDWMKCGLSDGSLHNAVIVGYDPVGDVALIKLMGRTDFPFAPLADSDKVVVGEWVFCVGNPFLLADDFQPTITYGIVSGVHRYQYPAGTLLEYADCIQTDAAINPGNSGGPLFNMRGEVIGINGRGSFEKRGRVNVGVGYAISINQIKHFMGALKAGRIVDHATLGATVASSDDGRVLVSDILEDSDAYRRGLRYGDEVVEFGGRPIGTVNAFKNALGIFPRDWATSLTYRREGKKQTIWVRLTGVHGAEELLQKVLGRPQPNPDQPPPDDHPQPEGEPKKQPTPPKQPPTKGPAAAKKAPMPDEVKPFFEARRGYANFHFNKANRTRVYNALVARGDFAALKGTWTLKGDVVPAGEATFEIADDFVNTSLPGGELKLNVTKELNDAVEPRGSGGLLAALHAWRRLLTAGPEKFGDLVYLGVLPVADESRGPVDVLKGAYAGVETFFFVESDSGRLLKVALYLSPDDDPCELLWSDYAEHQGRLLPRTLKVRYGDQIFGVYRFRELTLATGGK